MHMAKIQQLHNIARVAVKQKNMMKLINMKRLFLIIICFTKYRIYRVNGVLRCLKTAMKNWFP